MSLKLRVPTLGSQQSVQDLKDLILTSQSEAIVEINAEAKTVTIDSAASEETFKQLITAAGHRITPVN